VIDAAIAVLGARMKVVARSATRNTPPMGPAGRSFANAAVVIATGLEPLALLVRLKQIERDFGRGRGRRWGPRVLDLDILLWSGGPFRAGTRVSPLSIPHSGIATRDFVLRPLLEIVPDWRHPVLGVNVRQLRTRLHRATPVDRSRRHP